MSESPSCALCASPGTALCDDSTSFLCQCKFGFLGDSCETLLIDVDRTAWAVFKYIQIVISALLAIIALGSFIYFIRMREKRAILRILNTALVFIFAMIITVWFSIGILRMSFGVTKMRER